MVFEGQNTPAGSIEGGLPFGFRIFDGTKIGRYVEKFSLLEYALFGGLTM